MSITADRIKELRKQKQLTQSDLAKIINASRMAIANYETDRNKPSFAMLSLIADVLDTTVDYLEGKTDEEPAYLAIDNKITYINNKKDLGFNSKYLSESEFQFITDLSEDIILNGPKEPKLFNTNMIIYGVTPDEFTEIKKFVSYIKSQRKNTDTSSN